MGVKMNTEELLSMAIQFHGHKCPAMPLGLRAGLLALKKLGVERASNKELFCFLETGPSHAMMCFGDGVQVATGCTYGKGNIEKLNYSKNAITLIDVKNKRGVRVVVTPEFQKKGLNSEFVQHRKRGVEPRDISSKTVDPLIENVMKQPDDVLFRTTDVFDIEYKKQKGTFDWDKCENCGEIVFSHGLRLKNGKKLCISCFEEN